MSRQLLIPVKDLKTNENIDGLNNTIYAVKVVEVLKKRRKKYIVQNKNTTGKYCQNLMRGFNVVDSSLLVVLLFKYSTDLSLEAKRIAMLIKTSEE